MNIENITNRTQEIITNVISQIYEFYSAYDS